MAYDRKTWKFRDDITEDELNRMEDGIEEGIIKAEQAEQTAQQAAQTATQTANELVAHLAETVQDGVHGLTPERVRRILIGTEDPTPEIGEDGDIYFQYEE